MHRGEMKGTPNRKQEDEQPSVPSRFLLNSHGINLTKLTARRYVVQNPYCFYTPSEVFPAQPPANQWDSVNEIVKHAGVQIPHKIVAQLIEIIIYNKYG